MDARAPPPPSIKMMTDEDQLNSVINVQIIMTRLEWCEIWYALSKEYDRLEDRKRPKKKDYMEWFSHIMKKFHPQMGLDARAQSDDNGIR